jgi:hypothetical protein
MVRGRGRRWHGLFVGLELAPGLLTAIGFTKYLVTSHNKIKRSPFWQVCFDQVAVVGEAAREQFLTHLLSIFRPSVLAHLHFCPSPGHLLRLP